MNKFEKIQPLPDDLWSHDKLITDERAAAVRDPLVVIAQSGRRMVPATFEFRSSPSGDRSSPLLNGLYVKDYVPYNKRVEDLKDQKLDDFVVLDEEAEISILAVPLDEKNRVFSARRIINRVLDTNSPHSEILKRLTVFFPGIDFGLMGSWGFLLAKPQSDLDLFVYGGENFALVDSKLKDPYILKHLDFQPIPEERQDEYARDYSQRFNISFEQAKRIAKLRNRYLAGTKEGSIIKIALSGSFNREEYRMQTVLGSKKIHAVNEEGIAINIRNSASFPREYIVDIAGQPVSVISMEWVLQKMVETGDKVIVRGMLRAKNHLEFISLEKREDIIIQTLL
ncbi:MAG: hypothetical protein M1575_01315 [Patescibacteria group bacterium]|nr:hypothetical protein [Patescibacteria group bacterium]